jgi:predicted nuclease of predicted toxin-antitoxin system
MRLIADVHISPLTVAALKAQGYDIVRTTDLLPATAADAEILELARVQGRVVLTQDLDFSMLVALSNYGLPSLITLRLSSVKPDLVTQKLLDVLPTVETELTEGAAVTINDDSVRIRKLPIR